MDLAPVSPCGRDAPGKLPVMTLSADLAARIAALDFADLPQAAVANAKTAILDTMAVTLAGCREEAVRLLLKVPGLTGSGPSLVLGHPLRVEVLNAALINGVSAHALDFDDVNITMGGHPSAPILPALFALADMVDGDGRDFILAFVAGFEVETRIARGVNFHHYKKGWHPTATLGVFGAAAACARLLGLDEGRIAMALAIAASLASGIKANFGTMTKPLHVGHCARNGLLAALLAREGFTGGARAFEHDQGFLNVFNGPGSYDARRILEGWADPLEIVEPGAGIKLYPCCDSTHPAIDSVLTLKRRHGLDADQVARIDGHVHAMRLVHVNRPDPQSETDAKFSVQYCAARALVDGKIVLQHFEERAFRDPRVRELMKRVHIEPRSDPDFDSPGHYSTELTIQTTAGERHRIRVDQPYGRTPQDPLPPELLRAKFDSCVEAVLTPAQAGELHDAIQTLEHAASVRHLTSLAGHAARSST